MCILSISVTVYFSSGLRSHNCVHLYAEYRTLWFPCTDFMYIGNNLAPLEFSEWLLGMEFHALKLLEITWLVFQPVSLPLQDSSPEYTHQCLNHPVLKSLKQCLLWDFSAQSIRSSARQCLFIFILYLLSWSPSCLYPSPDTGAPVQERRQEVVFLGVLKAWCWDNYLCHLEAFLHLHGVITCLKTLPIGPQRIWTDSF